MPQSYIIFAFKLRAAQYKNLPCGQNLVTRKLVITRRKPEYKNLPCGQNLVIRFAHNNCSAISLAAGEYN